MEAVFINQDLDTYLIKIRIRIQKVSEHISNTGTDPDRNPAIENKSKTISLIIQACEESAKIKWVLACHNLKDIFKSHIMPVC